MNYDVLLEWILVIANLIFGLILTIVLYGAGPLIFYKIRKKPISKKRLTAFSIIYSGSAWLIFNSFKVIFLGEGMSTGIAAMLWGSIFHSYLEAALKKTGRLKSLGPESGPWKPEPLETKKTVPEEEAESVEPTSFYESEKAAEQKSQKFGPLDPPQKLKKTSAPSARHPRILYVICALSIVFGISAGIFFMYKANDIELRYEKGWHDGFNAGASDLEEKYNTLKHDYDSLVAEHRDLVVEHATLESEYDYAIERSDFLINSIGFIVDGSGYYHTYDCSKFQNADKFWAHNIEYCKSLGYPKCPYCW